MTEFVKFEIKFTLFLVRNLLDTIKVSFELTVIFSAIPMCTVFPSGDLGYVRTRQRNAALFLAAALPVPSAY